MILLGLVSVIKIQSNKIYTNTNKGINISQVPFHSNHSHTNCNILKSYSIFFFLLFSIIMQYDLKYNSTARSQRNKIIHVIFVKETYPLALVRVTPANHGMSSSSCICKGISRAFPKILPCDPASKRYVYKRKHVYRFYLAWLIFFCMTVKSCLVGGN